MSHVLLVVENLPLARDHRLRKQAATLVQHGYRVSVVCREDPRNTQVPGVQVLDYPAPADGSGVVGYAREYAYSLIAAGRLIRRTFRRDPFDAIQVSGTPDIYFAVTAPFRRRGVPVVFDQRDLSPELYELRYGRRDAVYRVLRRLECVSYRAADHVITVNGSLERVAYERGGLPPGRVSIVGNGPSMATVLRARARPELRRGRRKLCCWAGVMGPQDRVDIAVRAAARVVHRFGRTDTHFAFIGDGESRVAAQSLADSLGLTPYASFPGWLPEPAVHAYLATADVGIEPNLEAIVSPVKVMEYMAFAVAFVAFELAETRLLAADAGCYVRPGDVTGFAARLDGLLSDDRECAAMGARGRDRVIHQLSWECQQRTYLDVYRTLLARASGRRAQLVSSEVS